MKFSTVSTHYSNARKSVDFSDHEGGLLSRANETRNDLSPIRKTGVRFVTSQEQEKYEKNLGNKNQIKLVAEDNNGNVESLDTSSLTVSLRSENHELKTNSADNGALILEESFDSAL